MRTKPIVVVALGATLALSACTNPAMLDASDPNRNTRSGAIMGTIVGTGISAATGGSGRNLLLGAAAGAATGAVLGNQLDRQAADLRAQLATDGITVTNTGDSLIVTLPQDISFDSASYDVNAALQADLRRVGGYLIRFPDSQVQVIGHTDSSGDALMNVGLSVRRAEAVGNILLDSGVAPSRVQTIGRGEDAPLASNLTPEGRAQNRRVEIVVIPNTV
jgi:outer membrane protein OmpA-like peptidoglycan-associated protein